MVHEYDNVSVLTPYSYQLISHHSYKIPIGVEEPNELAPGDVFDRKEVVTYHGTIALDDWVL